MKFHVLTLFPEMISQGLAPSIIGRAVEKNMISLNTVNIRDYTLDKHGKVDDYPYGGGAGMLMQAQPVYDAWKAVTGGKKLRTVYVTPQGTPFTQAMAKELASEEELIFLCGHYEGIDQRVLEEVVTDYVSIGDYVLTGGELPAMVMIDAIARLIPGVLGNDTSAEEESFYNDLLEYPQYSRPEVWHDKKVPEVLLSGNHSKVNQWRLEQSKERTAAVRPDLYKKYEEKQALIKRMSKDKRNNIHIMESLARGQGEILYRQGNDVLVWDREAATCMMLCEDDKGVEQFLKKVPEHTKWLVLNQETTVERLSDMGYEIWGKCGQYLYTSRETLPVKYKDIRRLTLENLPYVSSRYEHDTAEYLKELILGGRMYGAFCDERQIGFVGTHSEGSVGLLYVEEAYRRQGIAEALLAYNINRSMERGWIPYGHVVEGNLPSEKLQEKMGLYKAGKPVWWLSPPKKDR